MPNKQTELLPAYLVVGDDALKRSAVVRRLRVRLAELGDLEFNSDVFDGAVADGQKIVNACNTVPFASEKRLVQVDNAEKLKKADMDALSEYLKNPSSTTVLCLVAEKMAKNLKLYKAVAALSSSAVIDCTAPKSYKMAAHVRQMAPTHNITLDQRAAERLVELVGVDTVRLDIELQKIASSHIENTPVSVEEIDELVARTAEVKPWQFIDAFASKNLAKVIELYPLLKDSTPYSILAMCVTRLRELICAETLIEEGRATVQNLAAELGDKEWRYKTHIQDAKRFGERKLRDAIISSMEAEKKMKSGTQPDAALMDWLISVLK